MWPFSGLRCERGGSRGLGSVVGGASALKTPPSPLPEKSFFYLYCCVALMFRGILCSVYLCVHEQLQNRTKDRVVYTHGTYHTYGCNVDRSIGKLRVSLIRLLSRRSYTNTFPVIYAYRLEMEGARAHRTVSGRPSLWSDCRHRRTERKATACLRQKKTLTYLP